VDTVNFRRSHWLCVWLTLPTGIQRNNADAPLHLHSSHCGTSSLECRGLTPVLALHVQGCVRTMRLYASWQGQPETKPVASSKIYSVHIGNGIQSQNVYQRGFVCCRSSRKSRLRPIGTSPLPTLFRNGAASFEADRQYSGSSWQATWHNFANWYGPMNTSTPVLAMPPGIQRHSVDAP
jgi:hypothetical protein